MKLFKKALAAVLAGVMALSMVACAPTTDPTKPEEPTTPVSDAAAAEVMKWLNYDIEKNNAKVGTKDEYGVVAVEKKLELIVNDSTLVAKAEAILEAMASDEADWTKETGKIYVPNSVIVEARNKKGLQIDLSKVCVVDAVNGLSWATISPAAIKKANDAKSFDIKAFTYEMTGDKSTKLAAWGKSVSQNAAYSNKVGVASKTINGKVYLVVVYEG